MQRRVGLDDDALVRRLLELFDQRGFARLERLGDFRIDTQREALRFEFGGHFSRLGLNLVADCRDRLDHAGAGAVGARLAQDAFEGLLRAFARNADQAEFIEGEGL